MAKRITNGQREEVKRLYDKGLNPYKIARQTGISYSSVYGMTRIRQRVNPETGKSFSSLEDLRDYNARQRVNKNKELSDLVKSRLKKLGKNQSWLAEKLGVSRRIISFYCQGRSMPKKEKLDALLKILNLERAKPESLDNLVEE